MFSIGITTVNRPYREPLFRQLVETGTLTHGLLKGFHISYDRGPNASAYHVLQQCVDDGTAYVVFLEDDIEIIDDFLGSTERWLYRYDEPNTRLFLLGCGARRALKDARGQGAGACRIPMKDYYGTCGFVMRRSDVVDFLRDVRTYPDKYMAWNGLDVNLKRWITSSYPLESWALTPTTCLINHLGATSSLSTDADHWTGTFAGWRDAAYQYWS